MVAALSAVLGSMILYNIFFGQGQYGGSDLASGSTGPSGKQSSSIMLKYEVLVEDVQRELLATGHFRGLVDGVNGPRTKFAVEAYQRDTGLAVTGEVTAKLLEHIRYTRKLSQAAEFTGSLSRAAAPVVTDKATPEDPPQAEAMPDSTASIDDAGATDMPVKDLAIVKLQLRLARLGYDPGSASGALDEGTKSAILTFEMDQGLAMQGEISDALIGAITKLEKQKSLQ